ncbi:MAG: c-type cytochrome [Methylococcales bacterium]
MIKTSKHLLPGAILATNLFLGGSMSQAIAGDVCKSEGTEVDEATWVGSKIYDRTFGRGCATCHDVSPNPKLLESVKKLSKDEFATVLKNGRNAMPKAIDAIKEVGPVKKAKLTDDQAIEAIWLYLNCRAEGKVPAGKVDKKK